jgi:hypothetical protein
LILTLSRDQPVTGVVLGIGAKAKASIRDRKRFPIIAVLLKGGDLMERGKIAEPPTTAPALSILKVERLPAGLAFEKLHQPDLILVCLLVSQQVATNDVWP